MDEKAIFKVCKDEGCCDACCLRYLGLKHPRTYENVKESARKYSDEPPVKTEAKSEAPGEATEANGANGDVEHSEEQGPPAKRPRGAPCPSCLGLLEPPAEPESCGKAQEILDKKQYDVTSFACALSAPLATLIRERYIALAIKEKLPDYNTGSITSLKEAWKWTVGRALSRHSGLALDSGASAVLLVTLHYDYLDEAQDLEVLKALSPSTFAPHRRPAVDVTRRGAELALAGASLPALRALQPPVRAASCVAATAARAPLLLAGRYIKLSRTLPQTPWLVRGRRVMESSVQEIIFKPIADLYGLSEPASEHRLKFIAAGREDVDVRCLGTGRPFAVEIADPQRALSEAELADVCTRIAASGELRVSCLTHVAREDLSELKKGEETKTKDYEALCIKLGHSELDEVSDPEAPVTVTEADVARIAAYRSSSDAAAAVCVAQRTPLRVLHRRPLLARDKRVISMEAALVPGHPSLLVLRLRAGAGLYVKEFVHGELGRSRPGLADALRAPVDLLKLDVTHVALPWPPTSTTQ